MCDKKRHFEVRNWLDSNLYVYKDKSSKENFSDAIKKYNELLDFWKDGECDIQLYEVLEEYNNLGD